MEKRGPVKPAEVLFPGRVTQVIDPHYFWMLMGSGIYDARKLVSVLAHLSRQAHKVSL